MSYGLALVLCSICVPWKSRLHPSNPNFGYAFRGYAAIWNPPKDIWWLRAQARRTEQAKSAPAAYSTAVVDFSRLGLEVTALSTLFALAFLLVPGSASKMSTAPGAVGVALPRHSQIGREQSEDSHEAGVEPPAETAPKPESNPEALLVRIQAALEDPAFTRVFLVILIALLFVVIAVELGPAIPEGWLDGLGGATLLVLVFGTLVGLAWWKARTDPSKRYLLTAPVAWRDLNWAGKTLVLMAGSTMAFMLLFAILDPEARWRLLLGVLTMCVLAIGVRLIFRRIRI
jgi:hypothetical protein